MFLPIFAKCAFCGHPAVQHELLAQMRGGKTISSLEALTGDEASLAEIAAVKRGACRGGGEPEGYSGCPKGCSAFVGP